MPSGSITVEIKGLEALRRRAEDGFGVPRGAEKGIRRAAVIVESAAKRNVHVLSGKLKSSTGHTISGSGLDTEASVGPQPGFGQPRGYTAGPSTKVQVGGFVFTDKSRKSRQRKTFNKGEPTIYGFYEEHGNRYRDGHPWLVPALTENEERINRVVNAEVSRALRGKE